MHRQVKDLLWAKTSERGPWGTARRLTPIQRQGLRYEARFGDHLRALGEIPLSSQWFEFQDLEGPGFCQTDHLIVRPDEVLIFECKRSYRPWVWDQLLRLYRPIVEEVFELPVRVAAACLYLNPEAQGQFRAPLDLFLESEHPQALVHWRP